MSIVSNLYAEKVFAEHPIGMWTLDDQVDYLSLVSENNRDIQQFWNYSESTVTEYVGNIKQPFLSSITNILQFDLFSESSKELKFVGPDIVNFDDLDKSIETLTIGSYFYSPGAYLSSVSVGFEYTDTSSAEIIEKVETFNVSVTGNWFLASGTIVYPNQITTLRPIIKVKFDGGSTNLDDYKIYTNGLSVGQFAERFNSTSLGVYSIPFPLDINLNNISGSITAQSYGLGESDGHYLISGNKLLCRNQGIPMVFGSSSTTKIISNNSAPSLLIPGLGFLNEAGRFKEYTLEMWIKINANTVDPLKIFGPISSDDGIYVEHGFLSIVVGGNFSSHFVGEWSRPMLLQIRLSVDNVSLIINGEEVINMAINTKTMSLPTEYTDSRSNDWLAFYSYSNVFPIEIDCVSIYPYKIPLSVAKRRWIYGQATPTTQEIDAVYNGKSIVADYTFSEYTSNYNYPKHGSWLQGISDNLGISSNNLYIPDYKLPEIFLDTKTLDDLYSDCKEINVESQKFITFRPSSSWNNLNTYMRIANYNFIKEDIYSIYGVFSIDEYPDNDEILIELSDSQNYLRALIIGQDLVYRFYYNGNTHDICIINNISINNKISVGFDFTSLVNYFGHNMLLFLSNKATMNTYIAGNKTGLNPFTGKIYTFGLCSNYNNNKINTYFNSQGVIANEHASDLLTHTASYTLIPEKEYGIFYLDIGVSAYWQDHIPLSYFASYVKNNDGNSIYDLDFLQFNIDHPSNFTFADIEQANAWTYNDLENKFDFPTQKQYNQLDNQLYTGWDNYVELDNQLVPTRVLDVSNNNINSYISLQFIADSANKTMRQFANTRKLEKNKVIDFSTINNWDTQLFEIVDNSLIYFPKTTNFHQLAIVIHLDFNIRGIGSKPIKIKNLELASKSLNKNAFNEIGTKYGKSIYPYVKTGIYYDYKIKNPIAIYKGSTPFLYNSGKDGFEIRNDLTEHIEKGIAIPMNENTSSLFSVNAVQLWIKYNLDKFPYGTVPVFEVDYADDVIQFFAIANSPSGKTARVFAKSKNGKSVNGMSYYLNGILVSQPTIDIDSWNVLSVSFGKNLNLNNKVGYININGPFIYNNISYYQSSSLKDIQNIVYRPWLKVLNDGINDIYWQYWLNNYLWDGVLVLSSTDRYSTSLKNVYSSYTGTNKIVFDTNSEDISFGGTSIKSFNSVEWQSYVINPV